jgi:hypothetical protein
MHHRSKSARTSTLTSAWFFRVSRLTGLVLMIGLTWQFCGIGVARADDNGLAWCLDIDGDGTIRAETDGILLLRWLFGFRGSVLIDGVTDPNGHRVTANAITAFLLRWDQFDADNDGVADALTDGLIAQRWLSGLRGAELVSGLLGVGARRADPDEIDQLLTEAQATGCDRVAERGADADYQQRLGILPARTRASYVRDHCLEPSTLDDLDFAEINEIESTHKPVDLHSGWFCEARVAGRPFRCMDQISVEGEAITFDRTAFNVPPGLTQVTQDLLDDHFDQNRTINKLWCGRCIRGRCPISLVINGDGNLNVGGTGSPMLPGAAFRTLLSGTPFGTDGDTEIAFDKLGFWTGKDVLYLVVNASGESIEATLRFKLGWNTAEEKPLVDVQTAVAARAQTQVGFGFNFMKGGVLFGRNGSAPKQGIASFHDGRTAFWLDANGDLVERIRMVPPNDTSVLPGTGNCDASGARMADHIVIADPITLPAELILDQAQTARLGYYSRFPDPLYGERTDLRLVIEPDSSTLTLRSAQVSVRYNCENPEAEETENLYLHTALATDAQAIWRYRLQADAADYETDHPAVEPRMLYVAEQRLWERRMDTLGNWIGEAHPLTDNTIKSPQNPDYACHARGAVVYFDASTSMTTERPRRDIYRLDLNNTTVRRLTNDPEGNSQDFAPTISADGTRIAFASTRAGTHGEITIAPTDLGLGAGMGNRLAPGDDCVWHPSLDILACADRSNRYVHPVHIGYSNLFLLDVGDAGQMMLIPERSGSISDPSWNPSGIRLAYALHDANDLPNGVYVVDRTGGDPLLVVGNGGHPAWLTDNQIVFHRADANGELDLFLVSVNGGAGGAEIRLTPQDGRSIEQPAHVRCP